MTFGAKQEPEPGALSAIALLIQQSWEVGWAIQTAFWDAASALARPPADHHACLDTHDQLVVPEPLAEDDEHGLFA